MSPEELLALARSDPQRSLRLGQSELELTSPEDHSKRAVIFRAIGTAARVAGTMRDAIAFAESALSEANEADDERLIVETMVHLSGSLAMAGDAVKALAVLDDAEALGNRTAAGLIWFQRGMIYTTTGETVSALDAYSRALPLARREPDNDLIGWTLQNRGLLHVYAGELSRAQSDLLAARTILEEKGDNTALAGVDHNLGLLAWYRGDIPAALRRLDDSEHRLMALSGATTPVHASRCEVLLSAGLYSEAHSLARKIAATNREHGLGEHEADALLVAAQAALLMKAPDEAVQFADAASRLFGNQGRAAWKINADRVAIEARAATGEVSGELRDAALTVAESLRRQRLFAASALARIVAGRIALDLGWLDQSSNDLGPVARVRTGPLELLVAAKLAGTLLRRGRNDHRGALRAAGAGLRLIELHQAAIGASDLRAGIESRGAELARLALQLSLETGRARSVFTWMERTRARSLRFRPVSPTNNADQAQDLAALRHLSSRIRTASGAEHSEIELRMRALQEVIKTRSRVTGGERTGGGYRDLCAEVVDNLGDHTLVEFAVVDGEVWAVVARDRRFSLRRVGTEEDVGREVSSLRFGLRALAQRGGATSRTESIAGRADEALFANLSIPEGPVILIPTAEMYVVPWFALPTIRGHPVTVAPSTELWLRRKADPQRSNGEVVVVAGPDLMLADAEARSVAKTHRASTLWPSRKAKVDGVRGSIEGSWIAHVACHAFFHSENPMFSSLRLTDGDLNVYDIERIKRAPSLVILSACDSGFTETRAGEELIGISSALLSMGTRSIIASVGLVPDSEATKDLMVGLHRGLAAGESPSVALHEAQQLVADTPEGYVAACSFICIGAG